MLTTTLPLLYCFICKSVISQLITELSSFKCSWRKTAFFPHNRRILLLCWHPKETPPVNNAWPGLMFKNCTSHICSLTLLMAQVFQGSIPAAVAPETLVGCHSYRGIHLPRTCCASQRTAQIPHSPQALPWYTGRGVSGLQGGTPEAHC